MTTTLSFYIEENQLEETKQVIRSLDSLRLNHDPQKKSSGRYNLSVSGKGEDVAKLEQHLETYTQPQHK